MGGSVRRVRFSSGNVGGGRDVRFSSGNVGGGSDVRFSSGKVGSDAVWSGEPSPAPNSGTSVGNSFHSLRSSFSFLQTPSADHQQHGQHHKKRMVREFALEQSPA